MVGLSQGEASNNPMHALLNYNLISPVAACSRHSAASSSSSSIWRVTAGRKDSRPTDLSPLRVMQREPRDKSKQRTTARMVRVYGNESRPCACNMLGTLHVSREKTCACGCDRSGRSVVKLLRFNDDMTPAADEKPAKPRHDTT